jgi:hypothetical protein
MSPDSIHALQSYALFASALQRSDELSAIEIRGAIDTALSAYGDTGCTGRVAQEFGDHPETAAVRMRWARAALDFLEDQPARRPDARPLAARMGRTAVADGFSFGRNPVAGLSAAV